MEYLGYILTRTGIKPQPNKVQAILAISMPKSVRDFRSFLGMVQYYRDLWARRNSVVILKSPEPIRPRNGHGTGMKYIK